MTSRKLVVGLLLVGGNGAWGQSPFTVKGPSPELPATLCVPPPATAGFSRLRSWCGRLQGPDGQPFGLSVTSHFDAHIQAGTAARMVFHDYDFHPDSSKLTYRGMDRVREVAQLMANNANPVVVERLPRDVALAEQRRQAVMAALVTVDPHVQPSRVVVAAPVAQPLSGADAILVFQTQNRLTTSTGFLPSATQGGTTPVTTGTRSSGGQTPDPTSPNR